MRDGYYLSTFLVEGKLPSALDIKLRHDQTVALWKKEKNRVSLIRYWELERFSGWKQNTYTFPTTDDLYSVIDYLLDTVGVTREEIIEIWGTPSIDTDRDYIRECEYNGIGYHNMCHLFSALLCEENKDHSPILAFALDSGPESIAQLDAYHKLYYAGAYMCDDKIHIFSVQSPGKLWSNSKKRFGLREGTLMALESACSARINEEYDKHINLIDEKALEDALLYLDGLDEHIKKVGFSIDDRFSYEENYISAFMKQVNKKTKEIVCDNVKKAIDEFGIQCDKTILGLAGGFTLNCPTNTLLMDTFNFSKMQIPPCANDSGEALGIGLLSFYHKMDEMPIFSLENAFHGADLDDLSGDNIKMALREFKDYIVSIDEFSSEQVAQDIVSDVVVWMQECAEIGPRALGHRSILGDPRKIEVKNRLNEIKGRQWWRPVAPIVIEDEVGLYFGQNRRSPYMLEAFEVKEIWKNIIPAVVHMDGTARVQTLSKADNDLLFKVLSSFKKLTGVSIVCNTSLNDKGEPIIQTVSQAIDFCLYKGIDILYVNGKRIKLMKVEQYKRTHVVRNEKLFKHLEDEEVAKTVSELNPNNLDKDALTYYFDNPEIYQRYDLKVASDCIEIEKLTKDFMKKNGISLRRDIL